MRNLVGQPENLGVLVPIAQIAADRLYGPEVADPLSVAIGFTLFASVSAYVLIGPRVAYAMASTHQFPATAGRLNARGAPAIATSLQVGWSLVLLWTASFEHILLYSGVGLALFSMLTISTVFILRQRGSAAAIPHTWLSACSVDLPGGYRSTDRRRFLRRTAVACYSLVSILLGVPVYYVWMRHGRR